MIKGVSENSLMEGPLFKIGNAGEKGKGLFALRNFSKGEIIFEEDPIVSCQFAWNEDYGYKACHHCLRPLETAEENVRRLTMKPNLTIRYPEQCMVNKMRHVICEFCFVKFCSAECRTLAWNKYHKALCRQGNRPNRTYTVDQLRQLWKEMHYPPETTTIMLFVRIFAMIHQAEDKGSVSRAIEQFCHSSPTDIDPSHNILGLKFSEHLDVLRENLVKCGVAEWAPQWATPEGFRSLVILVGRNGQGIGTSPVSDWVNNIKKLNLNSSEEESFNDYIEQLYEDFEKVVGTFLNNEGSGLYTIQSSMNHSCRPNAEVTFPNSNHRLAVKCIRNISAGEEICISYLEECALKKKRQGRQKMLLSHYFFKCKCVKCLEEKNHLGETSEEEADEEEELEMGAWGRGKK